MIEEQATNIQDDRVNGAGFSTVAPGADVQDEMVNVGPESVGFSLIAPTGEKVNRGVNIGADSASGKNYAREIIERRKTMEKRTSKGAIPQSMYHQWMAIVDTSRQDSENPVIIGYAKFGEPIDLSEPEVFEQYRAQTGIEPGDEYDLKPTDKAKWGYPVEDVIEIDPRPIPEGTRMNNRNKFFENVQDEMVNGNGKRSIIDVLNEDIFDSFVSEGLTDEQVKRTLVDGYGEKYGSSLYTNYLSYKGVAPLLDAMNKSAYNQIAEQIGEGSEAAAVYAGCVEAIRRMMTHGENRTDRGCTVNTARGSAICEIDSGNEVTVTAYNNTFEGVYETDKKSRDNHRLPGYYGYSRERERNRDGSIGSGSTQYNGQASEIPVTGEPGNIGRNLDASLQSEKRKTEITLSTTEPGGFSMPENSEPGFSTRAPVTGDTSEDLMSETLNPDFGYTPHGTVKPAGTKDQQAASTAIAWIGVSTSRHITSYTRRPIRIRTGATYTETGSKASSDEHSLPPSSFKTAEDMVSFLRTVKAV